MDVKYIVFSGGSVAGLSHVGVLDALQREVGQSHLACKGFSGSSIGCLVALLCVLGYTVPEIKAIALALTPDKVLDMSVMRLVEAQGLDDGEGFRAYAAELIEYKLMRSGGTSLTFRELWAVTGKELWFTAACLESQQAEYYSVHTTPTMPVVDALRRSISIPFLFTRAASRDGGRTYVDGGLLDSLPAHMFPVASTMCVYITSDAKTKYREEETIATAFMGYVGQLSSLVQNTLERYHSIPTLKEYFTVKAVCNTGTFDFDLSDAQKEGLLDCGYVALKVAFNRLN